MSRKISNVRIDGLIPQTDNVELIKMEVHRQNILAASSCQGSDDGDDDICDECGETPARCKCHSNDGDAERVQ